jgi:hypothetical protein
VRQLLSAFLHMILFGLGFGLLLTALSLGVPTGLVYRLLFGDLFTAGKKKGT